MYVCVAHGMFARLRYCLRLLYCVDMAEFLTPQEAADLLKLSVHTLSTWRSRQPTSGPPWVEVGGLIRYRRLDLDAWVSSRTRNGSVADA